MVIVYSQFNPILSQKDIASSIGKSCVVCNIIIDSYYRCICRDGPSILKLLVKDEDQDYFYMDGSIKPIAVKLFIY